MNPSSLAVGETVILMHHHSLCGRFNMDGEGMSAEWQSRRRLIEQQRPVEVGGIRLEHKAPEKLPAVRDRDLSERRAARAGAE